jgi:hypothetical protein
MNWYWIVLGWGVPLGIWLVVRAYGRLMRGAPVAERYGGTPARSTNSTAGH